MDLKEQNVGGGKTYDSRRAQEVSNPMRHKKIAGKGRSATDFVITANAIPGNKRCQILVILHQVLFSGDIVLDKTT